MTRPSVPVAEQETPAARTSGAWYVTFGQRYRRERHPRFPVAHPDGWLVVRGSGREIDEETARQAVLGLCGTGWSSIYASQVDLQPWRYPLGPLATLTVHKGGTVLEFNRGEYLLPPADDDEAVAW